MRLIIMMIMIMRVTMTVIMIMIMIVMVMVMVMVMIMIMIMMMIVNDADTSVESGVVLFWAMMMKTSTVIVAMASALKLTSTLSTARITHTIR